MSPSDSPSCSRCGTPIPANATDQLCPACLMSAAMMPHGVNTQTNLQGAKKSSLAVESIEFPYECGGYKLLGLLGRGGMGTVYEAEQRATGRRIALKVLAQQLDSPDMRQRFLREGRLAAGVSHPNSLYIFGSEEIDGTPVITMEIAGSGTLKDKLKKRGPLPVPEAVDAILDVISGLEAAFAGGVLHRDIKPSNCFVSPDGSIKVGDYGLSVSTLAKEDTYVTAAGVIMGTPAYAPPEQLRGDELDVRADIYSVGATLFTLLTGRAPFEGDNAVQVVANAVKEKPSSLTKFRDDVPLGLDRVVTRCLAKEPEGRYPNYSALRNALLPFSSKVPEPASILARLSAGWIDYLIAFLPAYVVLMLVVGASALLVQPLVDRTLYSARYYLVLLGVGVLYFSICEGIGGGGLGKWLRGLQVIRNKGRRPGLARASIRILIPLICMEGVRVPITMTFISSADWTGLQTAMFVVAAMVCGCIPALLALRARRENEYRTVWDIASGTRVVVKPQCTIRPSFDPLPQLKDAGGTGSLGPFQTIGPIVPGSWLVANDPVLRRRVWLLKRQAEAPSPARRNIARPGRLRWLQCVEEGDSTWDAYEANQGVPLSRFRDETPEGMPWSTMRLLLHDLALELWQSSRDETLPAQLSLDNVWITSEGRAVLLDYPWPHVSQPAEAIPVGDVAGQQRFLNAVAATVASTSLPLHARPLLQNLRDGKFEKLSFLAGTLRGLLDRPAEVSRTVRAASIFMLPVYVWIAFVVGRYHDKPWNDPLGIIVFSTVIVLGFMALIQFVVLPFRTTAGQSIFGLAVVNAEGEPASISRLLIRWAIVWLPLFFSLTCVAWLFAEPANSLTLGLIVVWMIVAVYAVIHPNRGLQDRMVDTWVVRR